MILSTIKDLFNEFFKKNMSDLSFLLLLNLPHKKNVIMNHKLLNRVYF